MKTSLTFRTQSYTAAVTRQQRGGLDFLVAPVVAIVEGVLNQWYVPAGEIQESAQRWNNAPLTINHPADDAGNNVSIKSTDLLLNSSVGTFENVSYNPETRGLVGELWINIANAKRSNEGAQALDALQAGRSLEVSTGYYVERLEARSGVFNDEIFSEIHHGLQPDHLALLPNSIGACSWKDGCGAPRVNIKTPIKINGKKLGETLSRMVKDQAGATMSASDIVKRMAETAGISADKVNEVMSGTIDFAPRKWLQGFALALDTDFTDLMLAADVDTIPYRRPDMAANTAKSNTACTCRTENATMKEAKVKALIANGGRWTETDRNWLMTLSEDQLDKLAPAEKPKVNTDTRTPLVNAMIGAGSYLETDRGFLMALEDATFDVLHNRAKTVIQNRTDARNRKIDAAIKSNRYTEADRGTLGALSDEQLERFVGNAAASTATAEPVSVDAYLQAAPEGVRQILANAVANEKARRENVIKALKAAKCPLSDADIANLTNNALESLADSYGADYEGAAGGAGPVDNEAIPAPPSLLLRRD